MYIFLILGMLWLRPPDSTCLNHYGSLISTHNTDTHHTLNAFNAFNTFNANSLGNIGSINTLDITYGYDGESPLDEKTYTIECERNNSFYHGKMIDPHVMQEFAESFTDFYESSDFEYTYEEYVVYDHTPYFTVVIIFENGKTITLKTESDYQCFIPWNIEYEGKTYVQFNGKITTAFMKILIEIDDETWRHYEKITTWGCYPAIVPDKYLDKGLSPDFPAGKDMITPEEERGKTHVVWEISIRDQAIGKPVSVKGKVIFITYNGLLCLDAKTGEKVWFMMFHDTKSGGIYFYREVKNLLIYDELVYAVGPDTLVYCLDYETGEVLWTYKSDGGNPFIEIVGDILLVFGRGIDCLDRRSGKKIRCLAEKSTRETIYNDEILFKNDDSSCYVLADIMTGDIIWEAEDSYGYNPVYHDGAIYIIRKKGEFTCIDVLSGKEVWSYLDTGVLSIEVFEDSILVLVSDEEMHFLASVVLLNKNGEELWRYTYSEGNIRMVFSHIVTAHIHGDFLFLMVGEGVIQAFNRDTGELFWKIEVRGFFATGFYIKGENIYFSMNDGELYCLKIDTGEILWKLVAEKELFIRVERESHAYMSEMKDNLIFVGTKKGRFFALSGYPLFMMMV